MSDEERDWRVKYREALSRLGSEEERAQVTVSCGITAFAEDDGPDNVFDRADKALYRAKKTGRNGCVVG